MNDKSRKNIFVNGLTLDVGGTKARANYYGENGVERFEIEGSFGRAEEGEEVFQDLADGLVSRLFQKSVEKVAVNLGGKNAEQIRRSVLTAFPNAQVRVERESGGVIARAILSEYGANILVMAGTGCIVFSRFRGKERVLGGWGYDIGDEGSGYYIGRKAVGYALRELDGEVGKELSLFTRTVFQESEPFISSSFEEFPKKRDSARGKLVRDRRGIAALSKVVAACAREGCPLSLRVLKENAEELGTLVSLASAGEEEEIRVVINGGVAVIADLWQDAFFAACPKVKRENAVFTNEAIDKVLKKFLEE